MNRTVTKALKPLLLAIFLFTSLGTSFVHAESATLIKTFRFSEASITADGQINAVLFNIPERIVPPATGTAGNSGMMPDLYLKVLDTGERQIGRIQVDGTPKTDGSLAISLPAADAGITERGKYILVAEAAITDTEFSSSSPVTVSYDPASSHIYPTFNTDSDSSSVIVLVGKPETSDTYYIVLKNGDTQVKRVQAKEGQNRLSGIQPGTYQVYLTTSQGRYSDPQSVTVSAPAPKEPAQAPLPDAVEADLKVLDNGTVSFNLPAASPFIQWALSLEVLNESKSVTLYTKVITAGSGTLAWRDAQLQPGSYTVRIKASDPASGAVVYSLPIQWTVPATEKSAASPAPAGSGTAATGSAGSNSDVPGDFQVPASIAINDNGTFTVQFDGTGVFSKYSYTLLVNDLNGTTLKSIPLYGSKTTYSLKRFNLPVGSYVLLIKMVNKQTNAFVFSEPFSWYTALINGVIVPGNFPGELAASTGDRVRVVIQPGIYYTTYSYYLIVLNGKGEEVKRMAVQPGNPEVSLSGLQLAEGIYKIRLIMVNPVSGVSYPSASIPWIVLNGGVSAETFPGSYIIGQDGSITVRIRLDGGFAKFTYTLIIMDQKRKALKRILVTSDNFIIQPSDLNLPDGAYTVCLNMTDPATNQSVHSEEETLAVNTSGSTGVFIDGQEQVYDTKPVIKDGSTLVPMRAIFEAFGAKVEWDGATRTVTAVKNDLSIKLTIDSTVAWLQSDRYDLEVPAQLINSTTMVPIRFVSEALGADVVWDARTQSILIQK